MASIHTRLTLWNTAVFAAVLAVYVAVVIVLLERGLMESLDEQLKEDAERIETAFEWSPDGATLLLADPDALAWVGRGDEDAVWIEISARDGRSFYRSPSLSARRLPVAGTELGEGRRFTTVALAGGVEARLLSFPEPVSSREVIFSIAREVEPFQRRLRDVETVWWLATPLAVLLALAGGWFLARRALAPVDRMRESADRLGAEQLDQRIAAPHQDDELGRLAATLNGMLGRLQRSFETLRQFTADASHELRTPLAAMRSELEVCLRGARSAADYREILESALEELGRLSQLIDALLMLSRADAGRVEVARESLALGELARAVCAELRVLAEEKDQRLECAAGALQVQADEVLARRVITNLVHNAIRYTPDCGAIEVGFENRGGAARLWVDDDGPGIAPEHRRRVFDRFYRIDKSRARRLGGSGLGLAIARWAVESMGGAIAVEDSPLGGARLAVRLPLERGEGAR